jgi:hypothetical protein
MRSSSIVNNARRPATSSSQKRFLTSVRCGLKQVSALMGSARPAAGQTVAGACVREPIFLK